MHKITSTQLRRPFFRPILKRTSWRTVHFYCIRICVFEGSSSHITRICSTHQQPRCSHNKNEKERQSPNEMNGLGEAKEKKLNERKYNNIRCTSVIVRTLTYTQAHRARLHMDKSLSPDAHDDRHHRQRIARTHRERNWCTKRTLNWTTKSQLK